MQIKFLFSYIIVLLSLLSVIVEKSPEGEKSLPRRIMLCSGKEINPNITYIYNASLEAAGKCYGYFNCTACKTCNFCAHCNSGGRCGVCSNMIDYKPSNQSPTISNPPLNIVPSEPSYSYIFESQTNLRSEANTNSSIISKLKISDRLVILDKTEKIVEVPPYGKDYWYKVRTDNNDIGWVFGKLIITEIQFIEISKNEGLTVENSYSYIKGDMVNVRLEPVVHGNNIITQLNINDLCRIIERTLNPETIPPYGNDYWYKIQHEDIIGWVFGKFLSEEKIGGSNNIATINGRFVNLRLRPNLNSTIMGRVYLGNKCIILEKSEFKTTIENYGTNFWYKIRTNRNEGWIFGAFVSFD